MSLPALVKKTRKERGMTLQELATFTGTSKSYIWELEHGRVPNPGLRNCAGISAALDLPLGIMAAALLKDTE